MNFAPKMSQIGLQMSEIWPNYETGAEHCAARHTSATPVPHLWTKSAGRVAPHQRIGATAQQLEIRALRNMTK